MPGRTLSILLYTLRMSLTFTDIDKQLANTDKKNKVPDLFRMDTNIYSGWFPSQEFPTEQIRLTN